MNLLQIDYFLMAADSESFTAAAQKLCVSQPAVSRVICTLENELDCTLFERMPRKVILTPSGKLFYDLFAEYRAKLISVTQTARTLENAKSGTIHLGLLAHMDFSDFILMLRDRLSCRYPNIALHTTSFDFAELRSALETHRVDAILTIEDSLFSIPSVISHIVAEEPRILLYSARHPLSSKPGLTPYDFREEIFLFVDDKSSCAADWVVKYCRPYGFLPKLKSVPNGASAFAGVQNLQGVTIMDHSVCQRSNTSFGHIQLNSFGHIVLAYLSSCQNPVLPMLINTIDAQT